MASSCTTVQDQVGQYRTPIAADIDLSVTRFIDDYSVFDAKIEPAQPVDRPPSRRRNPLGEPSIWTAPRCGPSRTRGRILEAFAEQAAIAIGNARLFNDLDESLARQRAMTDVLDAVSTARFDCNRCSTGSRPRRPPVRQHLERHGAAAGRPAAIGDRPARQPARVGSRRHLDQRRRDPLRHSRSSSTTGTTAPRISSPPPRIP